ncbi:MAG: TonB-dependent receptor [Sphingomonadaceae bacterium]
MTFRTVLLCSAVCFAFPLQARAEAPASQQSSTDTSTKTSGGTASTKADSDNASSAIVVTARRLDMARDSINPSLGTSQTLVTRAAIDVQPGGANNALSSVLLQAPGVSQDSTNNGEVHIRNEHGNVQYRLNGVTVPQAFSGFGADVDPRIANSVEILTGALPAQYGLHTSGVVNMTTRTGTFGLGGDVGVYGGSNNEINPSASFTDSYGATNVFLSGSYLENDLGMENPTSSRSAIHDHTEQWRGFGYASTVLGGEDRISAFGGAAIGRFQIPNQPGVTPEYKYLGQSDFDSTKLDQNQRQDTWFGVVAYQHSGDRLNFQIAPFYRYAKAQFTADPNGGTLMFNGTDSNLTETSYASGVQADASYTIGDSHTLRFGLFFQNEVSRSDSTNRVFAVDSNGMQSSDIPIVIPVAERVLGRTYSAYLQDEWKLTDDLTANYGVRFDKSDAQVKQHQFSPRFNLVWTPGENTTVHFGYARYFTPPPLTLIGKGTLAAFDGTTGAPEVQADDPIRAESDDVFDVGIQQKVGGHLTLGVDTYYKIARNLLDDTTLGGTQILAPFNYAKGHTWGVEFKASYNNGPLNAYFNMARGQQKATDIISNQYLIGADDYAYIANHYIYTDHSQKLTMSGGASLNLDDGIGKLKPAVDFVYGSGLRKDDPVGGVPNGGEQDPYIQVNLGVAQDFGYDKDHAWSLRFDVINLFDSVYEIHDGSGVGAGQPEYGPRRSFFVGLHKAF